MRTITVFVAGMIVGWLIAPDKGANTRSSLRKVFSRLKGGDENGQGLVDASVSSDDVLRNQ